MDSLVMRIKDRLKVETNIFRDLLALVEEERAVLLEGDHQRLLKTSQRKLELCRELAEAQRNRRELMSELAPPDSGDLKLKDLARFLPPAERGPFREQTRALGEMARLIESGNKNNRGFIEEALDMVEHILGILTGAGRNKAYGSSGRSQDNFTPSPRILAKEV